MLLLIPLPCVCCSDNGARAQDASVFPRCDFTHNKWQVYHEISDIISCLLTAESKNMHFNCTNSPVYKPRSSTTSASYILITLQQQQRRPFAEVRSAFYPWRWSYCLGRAWPQTGARKLVYIALGVFVSSFRFQEFQHSDKSVWTSEDW